MKRLPTQAVLPFGRKERVLNRQIGQRIHGKNVSRGPGRPRSKTVRVSHQARPTLSEKTAVHVTIRANRNVANLRTRRRFSAIKQAFVRFSAGEGRGFRLVHFSVLSNHLHFVVEADSKRALSLGMQKLLHSISRRLNALSVVEHGGRISTRAGSYRRLKGWLGRVFSDRYHAHLLETPTEMAHAIRYVLENAAHHYGVRAPDRFSSCAVDRQGLVAAARGFLLIRACKQYLSRSTA